MKYSALTWVKSTIDDSLKQTRQALEQFVENQEDRAPLQQCVTWLHEVRGVLSIMELQTAALLVQSVEGVFQALVAGKIVDAKEKEKTYDLLMRSLVQLPNYLDHLSIVQRDMPLALLPLINDLRKVRKQEPLNANQLFTPDLTVHIPQAKAVTLPDAKLKEHAQKMRAHFHKGLNAVIKNPKQPTEGLKTLYTVMQHMQQATGNAGITKIWWVTEGVLEALMQKGLALNNNILNSLKQMDVILKQIIERGNIALRQPPPKALLTNLLHFAATAHPKGKHIVQVKSVFKLQDYFPSDATLQATRLAFSGPDIELMKTVITLLKDDFARAEETLDIFNRSEAENRSINDLAPLMPLLTDIANTLGLLGLLVQRKSMLIQVKVIKEVTDGKRDTSLKNLLTIADALLQIDAALDILAVQGVHAKQRLQQSPSTEFSETPQFSIVLSVVVNEAKIELAQVIQPLVTFIDDPAQVDETFLEVPGRLKQVQGFLSILSHERAAKLLARCNQYIQKVFIKDKIVPPEEKQKALADTLIGIELYLDTLAGNPMDTEDILNNTERRLSLLFK